jgi:hypothetical protein
MWDHQDQLEDQELMVYLELEETKEEMDQGALPVCQAE